MIPLRQATASQEVCFSGFVSSANGDTEMTALTIANTDVNIWKNAAVAMVAKNSGGLTHMTKGNYYGVFDAVDTDTLGPGVAYVHMAGALPVKVEFCVFDTVVYDALYASTGRLNVNASYISGIDTSSSGLGALTVLGIMDSGTLQAGTASTVQLRSASGLTVDDAARFCQFEITSGTGFGQAPRIITAYTGSTKQASVSPDFLITPDNTTRYKIRAIAPQPDGLPLPANLIQVGGAAQGGVLPTLAQLNTSRYLKNTAGQLIFFDLVSSTDHVSPAIGITVTAQRTLGTAGWTTATGSVTEIGLGTYCLTTSAADTNADDVVFRFSGTGVDPVKIQVVAAS